jgi:hypothetical protein
MGGVGHAAASAGRAVRFGPGVPRRDAVYTVFLVYAAGLVVLLLGYTAGTVLFIVARRERNQQVYARPSSSLSPGPSVPSSGPSSGWRRV